jgi:5-methylcytosine-specific restriction endonuclease McrA
MRDLKTLVLNQGYEPIRIVEWQRAVTMIWLEKATVLTEYDDVVRSKHVSWKVPAVIWLRKKSKRFSPGIKLSRHFVYARDQWRCMYCGKKFPATQLTFDHVLPRARGGATTWENVVSSCTSCNQQKGNRLPEEAGMRLLQKPKRPRWLPALLVKSLACRSVPEQWYDYIGWLSAHAAA